MKKTLIATLLGLVLFSSCVDLDIAPKNLVTDKDLLSNDAGMKIYLSRMYSYMPFEDFKYMGKWGLNFNGWLAATGIEGTGEAVNRDDITRAFVGEDTPYWGMALTSLRDANYLLETLPSYRGSYAEITYNHYLGEAYFARAVIFYAMAKRFGGVPLVTRVIQYPADASTLEVPRASEEQTWDQICADFDQAAALLLPTSPVRGYANKYVALTYKSEAMLYAGCVAKYNEEVTGRLTGLGKKTGVRVMGFDASTWQTASKRYFTEAYKAAREVMKGGKYSLYKKKWSATDPEAQYLNMVEMFSDLTSPENIYVKEYLYPTSTHGYDAYSAPFIFRSPLSAGTCPTLDFVELFDGFDRYKDGTIRVTDGESVAQGHYKMYDQPMDFFKNAEPRLRAYVIFPGDYFKGKHIEIRGGIYTGSTPIKPLFTDYSYNDADNRYQMLDAYKKEPKTLYLSPRDGGSQEIVEVSKGVKMTAAGENGPFYDFPEATVTGFYGRKWLNTDPAFKNGEGKSAQPFVLMRYADVLLNAAEAAAELSLAGVAAPDGADLMLVATEAVNDIRERAGAKLIVGKLTADEQGRDVVRKERRKELAFEHKAKWDLRRWRVSHIENRAGFWGEEKDPTSFSNNSRYRFRGLYPFYSSQAKKYFFDAHFQWIANRTFEYNVVDYYFGIPGGEVTKSPVIDQQPNR
ncbi:MAG: RagB/SusD family nutrient uptake outer membrane protein [Alistipes sp.]